jgi:hypothetical protein
MRRLKTLAMTALLGAALLSLASPASADTKVFPLSQSEQARHAAKIINIRTPHPVVPLGNHLRAVKPLGNNKPPKTIVAKRPP